MRTKKRQVRRGDPELPFPKCVYCQERDGTQVEHVVARAFFGTPLPMIPKVPACRECNQLRGDGGERNMSHDEAYVRDRICMTLGADEHPDAGSVLTSKVFANLGRAESQRERQALIDSMRPTSMPLGPDRYLCGVWSFEFDMARFERVMRKIVRGLHAFHHRVPMPLNFGFETVRVMDDEMYQGCLTSLERYGPSPTYSIGDRQAVWYQYGPRDVTQLGNNWLIVFYTGSRSMCMPGRKVATAGDKT
jgi:hypothetical protein